MLFAKVAARPSYAIYLSLPPPHVCVCVFDSYLYIYKHTSKHKHFSIRSLSRRLKLISFHSHAQKHTRTLLLLVAQKCKFGPSSVCALPRKKVDEIVVQTATQVERAVMSHREFTTLGFAPTPPKFDFANEWH
jgi:hypothetical protein